MQALALGLLLAMPAVAAPPRVVTVVVSDAEGRPLPLAEVRVPGTDGRRTVDPATGIWEASLVYERDGTPRVFRRGTELSLTVTAPGYRPRRLEVRVRRRRNVIDVPLQPMPPPPVLPEGRATLEQLVEDWFLESSGGS